MRKTIVMIIATVFLLNIWTVSAINIFEVKNNEEEIPYSIEDVIYHTKTIPSSYPDERGVLGIYVKLVTKDEEILTANKAPVQILEYREDGQIPDNFYDETNANGYVEFNPLLNRTYIVLVQYDFPKYEIAFFGLNPTVEEQTLHIFLAERAGRRSDSYESMENIQTKNPPSTNERGNVHFFIWKLKVQNQEGQLPAKNTPVIMREQETGSDIVQENTNLNGYAVLQPYIDRSYEIEVEYNKKYEMAKVIVDPTVEDQCFNFYLLQRQFESDDSKVKVRIENFLEKIKSFQILQNLFEKIFEKTLNCLLL